MNALVQPPPASLLAQLHDRRIFVLYRLVPKAGAKSDKVPAHPLTGENIDAQDAAQWMLPHEAELWAQQWGQGYGVGLVISEGSGLFCIDLDSCRVGDGWQPHVSNFIGRFPGAYVETSVSRNGVHIIGTYTGAAPAHGTRNKDYRAELYTRARFIAVTGQGASGSVFTDCTQQLATFAAQFFPPHSAAEHGDWTDSPCEGSTPIASDDELIQRALRSTSAQVVWGGRASFADLYNANADVLARAFPPQSTGQTWDGSAADLALANALAFWTCKDCTRIERLMRQSNLTRPKWERVDYVRGTILRACADQRECYKGAPHVEAPHAEAAQAPQAVATVPPPPTAADGATSVPPPPSEAVPVSGASHAPTYNSRNKYEATLENLVHVLVRQEQTRIGFDTFRGRIMVAVAGTEDWRPLTDTDMIQLRETLGRVKGFAAIGKELMHDALQLIAERHKFDSAIVWLNGLVWDGKPRVERFLTDYCGTVDDEYTAAVSRYIWTGLAARVFEPGCQLDMVVALHSKQQGLYKSTALQGLVPDPELFTDGLELHNDDDNFKRLIRGKLVVEIAELAGLSKADVTLVKRVITRRWEEWIEKWQTQPTRYDRRCMLFATTNEEQFLPKDETGQRRWVPVEIARIDRERIKADREQLWAEGAVRYRRLAGERAAAGSHLQGGVDFEDAERLAAGRHAKHEQRDVWEPMIERWLSEPTPGPNGGALLPAPGTRPFTMNELLAGALHMHKERMDSKAEARAGRVLRQLGYDSRSIWLDGQFARRWVRKT